jgi:AcrR family transcriptional regulator
VPNTGRQSAHNHARKRATAAPTAGSASGTSNRTRIPAGHPALPSGLAPRKLPRQDRSQATVAAILEAAIELFSSRGFADTSTNAVARRAGISIGSLYQYFPNKDALIVALFDRHLEGVERLVGESLGWLRDPAVTLRDGIRRLLESLAALHDADPRLAHAADPHGAGATAGEALLRRRETQFRQHLVAVLEARPDVRPGNRELMATLLYEIVEAMSRTLMHGAAKRFPRGAAFEEATEAICRYLE